MKDGRIRVAWRKLAKSGDKTGIEIANNNSIIIIMETGWHLKVPIN